MTIRSFHRFRFVFRVCTPIHIGSGQRYVSEYDFRVEDRPQAKLVRVIDINRALERITEAELTRFGDGKIASHLSPAVAKEMTLAELPVFGTRSVGKEILGAIRDGHGRLYIPGSSLKGWFRSALLDAWVTAHRDQALELVRRTVEDKSLKKSPAAELEEAAFSVDVRKAEDAQFPNRDINRWVHISDAYFKNDMRAAACEVQVRSKSSRGKQSIPVWAECILPGSFFDAEVKFTVQDLSPWNELDEERKHLFGGDIINLLHDYSRHLIEAEEQYWSRHDQDVARRFRGALHGSNANTERPVYFPLGFGTGWLSKTIGRHLRSDPGLMRELLQRYALSRSKSPDPAAFPVGHRVVDGPAGWVPMGWVALAEVHPL